MRFIQEFGYTVKVGQDEAQQRWLIENDEALAKAMPAGTRYIGTFTVVFSSEKNAGSYRMLIELDSYGAMDKLAALNKDPQSEFGRLMRESTKFGDYDLAAPWSNTLLKDVIDAAIWDPQT
ncbi:MAG TPA: hypothetical protein VIV06_02725 [Candidatus Limnocylindrales bacterium]